jgi:hypothetical protein
MSALSRSAQLGLINELVRQMFNDGVNEDEVYQRLTLDTRFDKVRKATVHSIYAHLQKKRDLEEKKRMAKYSAKAEKLYYSEIEIESGNANGMYWRSDRIRNLDSRFIFIVHDLAEDQNFHHLTLADLFNSKYRLVLRLSLFSYFSETLQSPKVVSSLKLSTRSTENLVYLLSLILMSRFKIKTSR